MVFPLKKFLPLAIVSGSFLVASVIILGTDALKHKEQKKGASAAAGETTQGALAKFAETAPAASSGNVAPDTGVSAPETAAAAPESANYTDILAERIARKFIAENGKELSLVDGKPGLKTAPAEDLISDALAGEAANFDYRALKPVIDPKELVIVSASPEAAAAYLQSLTRVLIKHFSNLPANLKNPSLEIYRTLAQATERSLTELRGLPVPKDLAHLHAEELALLAARKNAYDAITLTEEDAVKAFIALQALSKIDSDFARLKERFVDYIVKNRIAI